MASVERSHPHHIKIVLSPSPFMVSRRDFVPSPFPYPTRDSVPDGYPYPSKVWEIQLVPQVDGEPAVPIGFS